MKRDEKLIVGPRRCGGARAAVCRSRGAGLIRDLDDLWDIIEPLLKRRYPAKTTGRPRADFRKVIDGVIFRLRSGCQWNHLPLAFGPDSTVHQWFQVWCRDGVMLDIWKILVKRCDVPGAVEWEWQSADGAMGKARLGGDYVG